jgi:glucosamine-6-phosphate deaminase
MMDDYVVPTAGGYEFCPAEAHYSCRRFAEEEIRAVFNRGLAPAMQLKRENVWFPDPARPQTYDERIQAAGGVDLFLLASGATDGHVAFNPPGTPADKATQIVPLANTTRHDNLATFPQFRSLAEVPAHGVSVGLGTIARLSREVLLVLHGAGKAPAFRQLVRCDGFTPRWPASIVFRCKGARILVDQIVAAGKGI